ncbi:MAG TPA: metallophosphoesterase family protein [Gemmataceae bacterium]|jgi:putative phosphoesterase|nr:metallophosphoesterase family protein [Gemmataceae bacterium]
MRTLLISDIHANWPALEAIQEPFDLCLCMGDLVDYGCEPGPVIDWVQKNVEHCIRGNHDHMVAQNVVTNGSSGFRYLSGVSRPISRERTTPEQRRYLASLPITNYLTLDGMKILLVHATPRDPLDEFAPPDVEFWKRRIDGLNVDLVCVGHTHYPYLLEVGRARILNPGSVGLQRDGDPRASYAILDFGHISLHRVEYPVERTLAALESSPMPELAKKSLAEIYRNGKLPNGNHKAKAEAATTERG